MLETPAARFDVAMHDLYRRIVLECRGHYHPRDFYGMIEKHGGLTTAHILLRDPNFFTYGFNRLCELRRPDLTMEAMILALNYKEELFSEKELATARERLEAGRRMSLRETV